MYFPISTPLWTHLHSFKLTFLFGSIQLCSILWPICSKQTLPVYTSFTYISIYGVGEVWVQLLGGQEAHANVILVLCTCIWNAPAFLLILSAFDDTGSLGYHPRRMVYRPSVSNLVTTFRFSSGNRDTELKPTTFSSSNFAFFLSLLFSWPPSDIVSLRAACWGYSLIIIWST